MNPYASHLGDRDPLAVIAATAHELDSKAGALSADAANRASKPGKWSAREVICHLADTEVAFAFRLRQALGEDNHVIQPFDQDRWADHYAAYNLGQALELFRVLRNWNLALIRSLKPEDFKRPVSHPERGAMTFQTLVETMAGHDLNHLKQLP